MPRMSAKDISRPRRTRGLLRRLAARFGELLTNFYAAAPREPRDEDEYRAMKRHRHAGMGYTRKER